MKMIKCGRSPQNIRPPGKYFKINQYNISKLFLYSGLKIVIYEDKNKYAENLTLNLDIKSSQIDDLANNECINKLSII